MKVKYLHPSGSPHGVVINMQDCNIIESEFELQLNFYVHFQTNTLGKGMNPLIPATIG